MADLETPVALFTYRRPEQTRRVVERILEAEPPQVLVVADGPADDAEREQVAAVRQTIAEADWECELSRNYADGNLGLKERFATGLEWIFDEVPEVIILEDDTLPDPTFFRFCDELLDRFRGDKRVWDITGRNEMGVYSQGGYSYHYSYYGSIWGWATWRSSYEEYDPEMVAWDDPIVRDRIRDLLVEGNQVEYAEDVYNRTWNGDHITWDYQWGFARHRNSGLSVVPAKNLVENIGFDEMATNTKTPNNFAGTPVRAMNFPISHPPFVGVDREYDRQFHLRRYDKSNLLKRWVSRIVEKFVL
jgi:hypothetical protein